MNAIVTSGNWQGHDDEDWLPVSAPCYDGVDYKKLLSGGQLMCITYTLLDKTLFLGFG